MDWIDASIEQPEELQTVWAYNDKDNFVALACLIYDEGWHWAVSNGIIYSKDGKIVSECELDDEYHFDFWCPLPNLPNPAQ